MNFVQPYSKGARNRSVFLRKNRSPEYKDLSEKNKKFYKDSYDMILKGVKKSLKKSSTKNIFKRWAIENRSLLLPEKEIINKDKPYTYDIKSNPLKYLKYLIFMNKNLEENDRKTIQVLPLRSTLTACHIALDTKALIDISKVNRYDDFNDIFNPAIIDAKVDLYKNINSNKNYIWNKLFKMKCFKDTPKYTFDYRKV